MTKFVHTADWQLGMTRHFLSEEAQARFTAARIEAISHRCAGGGGGLFVRRGLRRRVRVQPGRAPGDRPLARSDEGHPGRHLLPLPGNHDPLDAASVFRSKCFVDNCPANVVVLESGEPVLAAEGVEIVGAPWSNKRPLVDLVARAVAELPSDGTLRVVVGHGSTDSLSPNPNDPALVALNGLETAVAAGTVHYVALGDRHSTTEVGGSGRIWYSGTPEPTSYDEIDPGNVLIVDSLPTRSASNATASAPGDSCVGTST